MVTIDSVVSKRFIGQILLLLLLHVVHSLFLIILVGIDVWYGLLVLLVRLRQARLPIIIVVIIVVCIHSLLLLLLLHGGA